MKKPGKPIVFILPALAVVLVASWNAHGQQPGEKYVLPGLQEDNITRNRPKTPGLPLDYILIAPGGQRILRFDIPFGRISIDDPDLLEARFEDNSIILTAGRAQGVTRVVIQARMPDGSTTINERLLFHALVGIGTRVTAGGIGGKSVVTLDCTPLCIPTPGREPREPDQIIEYRGTPSPPPPPPLPNR